MNAERDYGNSFLMPVMEFLERQPGLPFCAQCLAHGTGLHAEEGHRALARLHSPRFSREQRRCVRCFRIGDVVYATG
jgi:hypothetical protein